MELPRSLTGARITISWKSGARGPKALVSPCPGKGRLLSENPLFLSVSQKGMALFYATDALKAGRAAHYSLFFSLLSGAFFTED